MARQIPLLIEKKFKKRKVARAVSLRGHNHIIFKAKASILRKNHPVIKHLIQETQTRYGIKLKALAIQADHVHFLAKVPSRKAFANATRFLASQIALKIARGKLWKERVWSRTVTALKDFQNVMLYVWKNPFKAGVSSPQDYLFLQNGMLVDIPDFQSPVTVQQISFW